ncbi:MAG: hypothetical protein ACYCVY_11205 [Acidiferrobacteraceae bacterium]
METEMDVQKEVKSLRALALDTVPLEMREHLLAWAAEHHISEPNDPFWPIAGAVANGLSAAKTAGEAAAATQETAAKIPDVIYQSTIKAASDLRAIVADEVKHRGIELGSAITAAIQSAADTGAAALRAAAADLPGVAAKSQDEIVRDWKAALAQAAKDEARSALAGRMARSWGMVVLSLLLAFSAGAGAMWGAARMTGHLTPWSYPLQLTSGGNPACGVLQARGGAAYRICYARP